MDSWQHVLRWRATVHPDVLALVDDRGQQMTYRELSTAVGRRAGGWAARGIAVGDVVAVVAANSAEFFVEVFALQRLGAIPALVNWRLTAPEIRDLLALLEPVAVVADADYLPLVESAAPQLTDRVVIGPSVDGWTSCDQVDADPPPWPEQSLRGESVLALVHTSGTTGRPKAIPLQHGPLIRAVAGSALEIGDQIVGSHHLQLMPLFHLGGFGQAMQCLLTAGTLHIATRFDPHTAVDLISRGRIEFFTAAPALIDLMVVDIRAREVAPDLSSLREIQYGAAPITPRVLTDALAVLGCRFRQIYGNTESQSMISLLAPDEHRPDNPRLASAGRVAFGWEVKVVGPDGSDVAPELPGELLIRGQSLFPGYWRDDAATAAAFTPDGWFRTGDIVSLSGDGYLHVLDRARDMVITGGENVFPTEVEAVLAEHPDVAEATVLGLPDERWGETVLAVVIPARAEHADAEALIAWCRERLAGFKCPRTIRFADALPRTATGKVLKREIRQELVDVGRPDSIGTPESSAPH